MQLFNFISLTLISLTHSAPQASSNGLAEALSLTYRVDFYKDILHKGEKMTTGPSLFCTDLPKKYQNEASSAHWEFSNPSDFEIRFYTELSCRGKMKSWLGNTTWDNQPNNFVVDDINDKIKSFRLWFIGSDE